MIKLTQTIALLLIISLIGCERSKVEEPSNLPSEAQLDQFDRTLSALAADMSISAYSYAIVTNGSILKLKENGIAPDQPIDIGGVSDLMLSTLLLRYSDSKTFNINNRLSDHGISGEMARVPIRGILSHTHGVTSQPININPDNYTLIYQSIAATTGKDVPSLFRSHFGRRLGLKSSSISKDDSGVTALSTLNDLVKLSMAIDNQRTLKDEYMHNLMFRSVYLETGERSPAGLGNFIGFIDSRKFVWSAGQTPEYATLLIKSTTDSISLIVVAESDAMNKNFGLHNGQLQSTPIFHALLDALPVKDIARISPNFYDSNEAIKATINKMIALGLRDAAYSKLSTYITMYHAMGSTERFKELSAIYNELFPKDMPVGLLVKEPVADISGVMDYMQLKRAFTLDGEAKLNLFATAEFTKEMTQVPWEYDNVELFFDVNHDRSSSFSTNSGHRQYRFNYDFQDISGNAPTFEGINLVQHDPSPTRYNFEIAIPWAVLFNTDTLNPELNMRMGFDIAIADNDGESRKGSLAWNSELNTSPWANTTSYGTIRLVQSPGAANDTTCYAVAARQPLVLDGQNSGEWNGVPRYPINKEYMNGITGPDDLSGWFRAQWDMDNLYIFVEVQDDVKRLLEETGDYGWITNAAQDTVWMLTPKITQHAGGDKTNRLLNTSIALPAGDYTLHYRTNQTHSWGRWTKDRPEVSFYGIAVFKE